MFNRVNKSLDVPLTRLIVYFVGLIFFAGMSWAAITFHTGDETSHMSLQEAHEAVLTKAKTGENKEDISELKFALKELTYISLANERGLGLIEVKFISIEKIQDRQDKKLDEILRRLP